jgi:hypothetical protein
VRGFFHTNIIIAVYPHSYKGFFALVDNKFKIMDELESIMNDIESYEAENGSSRLCCPR